MSRKYKIGKGFIISNYLELKQQVTTTSPQPPFSLNNPPPSFLRGADVPGSPYIGKELRSSEPDAVPTNGVILTEAFDPIITEGGEFLIIE